MEAFVKIKRKYEGSAKEGCNTMKTLSAKPLRQEIIAGITAFFAISYIIIVNPMILADAGIPAELSVFATIFASVLGCFIMGIWADAPIVLTPGMGVNAFFTYTVVVNMGFSWSEALAISFLSGLIFILIACTRCAALLAQAIPASLKYAITAGIGLFLVEIGLEKAELIRAGTNSIITMGSLQNPHALLALFGLVLSLALYLRGVMGSFFIAIIVTSLVGCFFGVNSGAAASVQLHDLARYSEIFAKVDFRHVFSSSFLLSVFSMSMILVFESMGILEGMLPDKAKFKRAFAASSCMTVASSLLGTSPTVAAAESAAGIAGGGKTGVMALTAGILFGASLFFIPFLSYVPQAAIAPVIIITGAMMMQQLQHMDFRDFTEWFPAFLIIVLIPLTGSISTGLAFGFSAYPLLKLFTGQGREIPLLGYCLGFLFLMDLVFQAGF